MSTAPFWFMLPLVFGLGSGDRTPAPVVRRSLGIGCVSIPADFQVETEGHVDWVSGQIRTPGGEFTAGFAVGYTLESAVTPAKRRQFRWFKTETIGNSTLYYGLGTSDGKQVLQATIDVRRRAS